MKTGNVVTSDQGAGMGAIGVKTGGQECFEMVKGGKYHTLESQGRGHLTLESAKGGGSHTLDGRGYGHTAAEAYRYSYSDWQNFTHPQLTEVIMLIYIYSWFTFPLLIVIIYSCGWYILRDAFEFTLLN